jgi:hypothetical protein
MGRAGYWVVACPRVSAQTAEVLPGFFQVPRLAQNPLGRVHRRSPVRGGVRKEFLSEEGRAPSEEDVLTDLRRRITGAI